MNGFADNLKWRPKRASEQSRDYKVILRSSRSLVKNLQNKRNVCFVTLGLKQVNGVMTEDIALKAYVTHKEDVPSEHRIPQIIEIKHPKAKGRRVQTDVVKLPSAPIALGARAGELIAVADMTKGMSCLAFIKNGQGYIATNAHVIENIITHQIYQSAIQEPLSGKIYALANAVYLSPFTPGISTNEDLAVIKAGSVPVDHLGIINEPYPIAKFGDFFEDLSAQYWYNVNGTRMNCGYPEPSPPGSAIPVLVDGVYYPYKDFWRLQVMTGMPALGHSGSIVCHGEGQNITACGILFGASPPSFAYVFPLNPLLYNVVNSL